MVTELTTTVGSTYFGYDPLDRLTDACSGGSCVPAGAAPLPCLACTPGTLSRPEATTTPDPSDLETSWTYDPVGNRLTQVDYLGTTTYAYDDTDRLTSATAPDQTVTLYSYDANGNQTAAGADSFTFDSADRLIAASANGLTETYAYTGDGVRLASTVGADTVEFLTDRAFGLPQTAIERDGAGTVLRTYAYGLGRIGQVAPASGPQYLHVDGLGSVTDLTDPAGASLVWTDYAPFGAIRSQGIAAGAVPSVYGFTGEYRDPTGLLHLRARQYDPGSGRFTALDPLGPAVGDPYVSAYAYVNNNPIRYTDPSGSLSVLLRSEPQWV